jgi:hypothetical protein
MEGSYPQTVVKVVDSVGATVSTPAVTLEILPPTSAPLTIGGTPASMHLSLGQALSIQFTVSGGVPGNSGPPVYSPTGYAFSILSGALPCCFSVDRQYGAINGNVPSNPIVLGTYPDIIVQVIDAVGHVAIAQPFTIVISALGVSGSPSATATVGTAYSAQFTANNGTPAYTYSMIGTLPAGLSLNASTGLISGTPSSGSEGLYPNLQVQATDANGGTGPSDAFSITVGD